MDKLASENNGIKYTLIAVNEFLRLVRVQTLKTKHATESLQAFKKNDFSKKTTLKLFGLIKNRIWQSFPTILQGERY